MLPRSLKVILAHAQTTVDEAPWVDTNPITYFVHAITHMAYAFEHFNKLWKSFDDPEQFERRFHYIYKGMYDAESCINRPECVNVRTSIESVIIRAGHPIYKEEDSEGIMENITLRELFEAYWRRDKKTIAEFLGVDENELGEAPSLDSLLDQLDAPATPDD
jgi:lambda repressor-like predicted transcriptional regulator